MKKLTFLLILCLALVLIFSCGKKPPPGGLMEEEPIIIEEEEEAEILEEYEEIAEEAVEETTVIETPPPPTPSIVYRVQIGAFYSAEGANRRKTRAISLFDKPIYIEYIAPYYKVRVGDFATETEAAIYKAKVVRYFGDAFVAETSKTP
ncbi:MAG: SPOR domain-containing protein [Candidatus Cloacimonadota bacterium]|nr:MAG: SPOR domain-containing protein [Candidatus Cloacimonadota bacterium]